MSKNIFEERKIISLCDDHFGGILGETLFNFLIKENWIQKDEKEFLITENGWNQLEIIGIDVEKLRTTNKKKVNSCIELYYGIFHEHTGAYLGSLLAEWLIDSGWVVKKVEGYYNLTKKGLQGLKSLDVDLKFYEEFI